MKRDKTCADCGKPVTRTRCKSCAVRLRYAERGTETERFWSRVDASGDCWLWTGATSDTGYGTTHIGGITRSAHRAAYELLVGQVPAGHQLDHLCRVRACVNPDHLEPVTHRVNCLRGAAPSVITHRTGFCRRGHPIGGANIDHPGAFGRCRTCIRANTRRRYAERRAA